ncbi:TolC family protein [Chania multitudinisentens]|uniref:TolC family protein n=1 Tax=Chania multitudinisentens TaxID=1639108 RepID=UPI0003E12F47|nr:TolC family protein [Chania multitudinisentens]
MAYKHSEFRRLNVAMAIAVCLPFSVLAVTQPSAHEQDINALPPMLTQEEYMTLFHSDRPAAEGTALNGGETSAASSEAPQFLKDLAAMGEANTPVSRQDPVSSAPEVKTEARPLFSQNTVVENAQPAVAAKPHDTVQPGNSFSVSPPDSPLVAPKTAESSRLVTRIEPPVPVKTTEVAASNTERLSTPVQPDSSAAPVTQNNPPVLVNRTELRAKANIAPEPPAGSSQAVLRSKSDLFPAVQQQYQPDPAYDNVRWHGEIAGESDKRNLSEMTRDAYKGRSTNPSRAFIRSMVSLALTHSPEIRSSEADVLAAGYYVDQTKGQRWPQVQVGVSTPLGTQGGNADLQRNNAKASDTSGSVSITTPIYDWGKARNQIDSAEEGVTAAVNAQNYTKEQLAYSTVSELMNLSRYQESRVVALAYVERMKQLADMLSQITAVDRGRASEFTQAKAKLLSARASLDDIEHQVSTSRIRLVRLLGIEPNLPENISWRDSVMPASMAIASLTKNPNLLKLQAQVKAAEYEADSIKSAGLPQLNWVVSKNTAKDINGDETGWYTGLNVQWNAFSGGSQTAAQMSARARANGAQQQYEVAYRDLEYQINNLVQTRDSSFMRAEDFDRLSAETDRVRQMFYDQWYNLGKRTLLDVLTAENDHFNNQLSAINNRYDGYIANINVIASAAMLLSWIDK